MSTLVFYNVLEADKSKCRPALFRIWLMTDCACIIVLQFGETMRKFDPNTRNGAPQAQYRRAHLESWAGMAQSWRDSKPGVAEQAKQDIWPE